MRELGVQVRELLLCVWKRGERERERRAVPRVASAGLVGRCRQGERKEQGVEGKAREKWDMYEREGERERDKERERDREIEREREK
jgi:hypothetical protein